MIRRMSLRLILLLVSVCAAAVAQADAVPTTQPSVNLRVNAGKPLRTMAGGIGASWHAIGALEPRIPARGSAWGANPPPDDADAWNQIERHARWLGLDFIRVEIDQRMYEPRRGAFDWDNPEMRTFYRILDWCQKNQADVYLQQMWPGVEWNALPGVDPIRSAPRSMEDFADGIATLTEHLLKQKKFTCIRWLCIENEPQWILWRDAHGLLPIVDGLNAVRKALDGRGIDLPLGGPDWTRLPPLVGREIDFDSAIGAYGIHSYRFADLEADMGQKQKIMSDWSAWAHARHKPFFMVEVGDGSAPGTYPGVLTIAEMFLRGLAAGIDGLSRYSFLNRGDIDGQWQLVRTWDAVNNRFLKKIVPEPVPYFGFGIITRLAAKHSDVLASEVDGGGGKILCGALCSPSGRITIWILNLGEARNLTVNVKDAANSTFYPYQVTARRLDEPGFMLRPGEPIELQSGKTSLPMPLPRQSITALSNYDLHPEDPGITADDARGEQKP
jgi:hypothetical protein